MEAVLTPTIKPNSGTMSKRKTGEGEKEKQKGEREKRKEKQRREAGGGGGGGSTRGGGKGGRQFIFSRQTTHESIANSMVHVRCKVNKYSENMNNGWAKT